jgi:tol-pal system protein YbgF
MDAGGEHDQAGLAGPGEPPRILGTLTLADPGAASGQTEAMPGDPNAPLDLSRLARPDGAPAAGGAPQPGSELASLPPPATADAAYDRAYTQLVSGDYDLAEAGFRQFVANYPDNELAPDARYWLGETFFARGDYRNAADTFLSSYRTHPSGRKAPDTLLKLGLSLDALGERKAACATYAELLAKHQGASNALIQRVKAEQARAEC